MTCPASGNTAVAAEGQCGLASTVVPEPGPGGCTCTFLSHVCLRGFLLGSLYTGGRGLLSDGHVLPGLCVGPREATCDAAQRHRPAVALGAARALGRSQATWGRRVGSAALKAGGRKVFSTSEEEILQKIYLLR